MDRTAEKALALLAEHGGRLHALLLRLTLREDVAEDLMQEVFLKLAYGGGLTQARDALAYGIRVATNLAFDWRRAQRRTPATKSADETLREPGRSPLVELVGKEELERVLDALGRLPRRDRDLVVMKYLQQKDYRAMAQELGQTPHQVRAICHKALRRLRRLVETVSERE